MLLDAIGSSIGRYGMPLDAERHKLNSPREDRAALIQAHQKRGEREQHPVQEHENPEVVQTPDVLPHIK